VKAVHRRIALEISYQKYLPAMKKEIKILNQTTDTSICAIIGNTKLKTLRLKLAIISLVQASYFSLAFFFS